MLSLPQFAAIDPRKKLMRHLARAGVARIDRSGRRALARALQVAQWHCDLAILDLLRRRRLTVDGDQVRLTAALSRTAAA